MDKKVKSKSAHGKMVSTPRKLKVSKTKTTQTPSGKTKSYKHGSLKVTKNKTKSRSYVEKTNERWLNNLTKDHPYKSSRLSKSKTNKKSGVHKSRVVRNVSGASIGGSSTRVTKTKSTPNKTKTITKSYRNGRMISKTKKK